MNKKQREIIADAYEQYIRNAMRGDPVGGFSDFADLFSRTDRKGRGAYSHDATVMVALHRYPNVCI